MGTKSYSSGQTSTLKVWYHAKITLQMFSNHRLPIQSASERLEVEKNQSINQSSPSVDGSSFIKCMPRHLEMHISTLTALIFFYQIDGRLDKASVLAGRCKQNAKYGVSDGLRCFKDTSS